uniref:Beta-D-glucoside glucohydrolase, periplasmic n=1 Tax=mine drainage metagenome TaxID=410659 RepID=E6QN30_9ZZZZ
MFDHPYIAPTPAYVATPEKRAQARKVADETIVLLKNDGIEGHGKLLPLGKSVKTVALVGPLADSQQDMLGSWSALGNPKDAITLRQALAERLGSDHLLYAKGVEVLYGQDEVNLRHALGQPETPVWDETKGIADAVAIAKKSDVVIMALGESAVWMTGEATSRADLNLPGHQEQLLEAVAATGKPVVLVMFTGRPSTIPWAGKHIPAIVEAWFPGMEGGHAVADVLFGGVNPSARLTTSFPRAVGQEPLYYSQLPTGRPAHGDLNHLPADSGEKYMSRYLDVNNSALYPFGWGLSYTTFRFSQPRLSQTEIAAAELKPGSSANVMVTASVTNIGSVAGTEVAQLYIRNTSASVEQPVRVLKGFTRVTLQPGETRTVTFPLGFDELSFYNVQSQKVVEPTVYKIFVGGNSLADLTTSLTVR